LPAHYFPSNYEDSRQRFRQEIKKLQAVESGEWKIPSKKENDLFTDWAYWPAQKRAETLLVITSGIHGSETYAGSAILQMFLSEIFPKVDRSQIGIFLVHAMNPYGFKYHQRTTENGVNLNRNFSVSGDLYRSRNLASEDMHDKFFERKPVASDKSQLFNHLKKRDEKIFFDEISFDEYIKAVAPGQFRRAEDLEFGGRALEPQSRFLVEKMRALIPQYQDILAFDLHTGLGDKNRLHLLTSGSGEDLHPDMFAKLFDQKADKEFYVHTPPSEEGFYEVHGAINSMFVDLSVARQRVCAITMEFGTLGHSLEAQLDGLNSFIITHQGFYYGYINEDLKSRIEKDNFERSYPQTDEWRKAVVDASRGLFTNVLRRAGSLK
jgi:hypothetical protein